MTKLHRAGAVVSLGSDSAASNNNLNMLNELNTFYRFHRLLSSDKTLFTPEKSFWCATKYAAEALYKPLLGELKESNEADFMVFSGNKVKDNIFDVLINASSKDITDLYIAGTPIMTNGELTTIDEKEVLEKAVYWQKKIA
jgi:5-methylthioadenosine/S-adenosylhomocysteine deaminase